MPSSVNKVIILGNLGNDPEVRNMPGGGKVATLSVATSESWRDKNTGEKRERTEWHKVVIFNDALAGVAERYLRKGGKVYIEGQLQTRKWQDQSGQDRYSTEIVLQGFGGQLVLLGDGGSSSGRTLGFDLKNVGSIPTLATKSAEGADLQTKKERSNVLQPRQPFCAFLLKRLHSVALQNHRHPPRR